MRKTLDELNKGHNAEVELRSNSLHINPPSGRSYYLPFGEWIEGVCPTCEGEGKWDSCFDCGNRGYNFV